ncbi:SRPBCC family protein [Pseudohongiella spirulinae]|uniref:Polyketide cyclase / dehydrase and lipid transport n=1 Tax=Pseudohongiella spirulinae TaxID=1249552 RepID=A0A0S2K9Q7_9GAMM|nr:SRPBCC family protein [Pseudohongiella spirulinae]ALO45072.1 Polyketide cyclase / dehydrase and lipid transport [Pseudohongiella spirulinae]
MKKYLLAWLAAPLLLVSPLTQADAEYVTVKMEIDVNRSAEQVWARVGDYCAISDWLGIDCTISEGDGGIGTVRVLAGGRITEVMVAQTPLSYGYAQPAVQGEFYNLYHGFMEARPTGANSSKLLYTLILDVSNLADQAAKDTDIARRRATFERALGNMKAMAEE